MAAKNLNELYSVYKEAGSLDREVALNKLVKAMFRDANAIVWHKLRGNHPHIVSDSVSQAVMYLDTFRGESKFSTWFYEIVSNFCNTSLRRKLQKQEISLEQYTEDVQELAAPEAKTDSKAELTSILDALKPLDRKVVVLKGKGHSHREIAVALGLTTKAVNQRWARVKERLSAKERQGTSSATTAGSATSGSAR